MTLINDFIIEKKFMIYKMIFTIKNLIKGIYPIKKLDNISIPIYLITEKLGVIFSTDALSVVW